MSNNSNNKEKMLQQAEIPNWETIFEDCSKNRARAKELYDGKIFVSDVFVSRISTIDCAVYVKKSDGEYHSQTLLIYLPTEELAKINIGDTIKVVGKFDSEWLALNSSYVIEIVESK